jgi:hypothetical protein
MSNPIHNIEGNWEIALAGDEDKSTICTFTQTGTALTGIFDESLSNLPIKGDLSNDGKIAFVAQLDQNSIEFFGMVDGEIMYGIVDFPMKKGRKNWTAIKVIDAQKILNI